MLTLPIKKKWFDLILSGEKREEYRKISPYYASRFQNLFQRNTDEKRDLLSERILQYVSVVRSRVHLRYRRRKRGMWSRARTNVLSATYQENLNANNKYHLDGKTGGSI